MNSFNSIAFLGLILSMTANAAETKPGKRISVTRFNQQIERITDRCRGWEYSEQNQLQTELETELSNRGLTVLERRSIRKIYDDEYNLPNMDQKSTPKRGKFLSAQYTVTGAVVELGVCDDSSGSGIQLGGIVSLLGGPSSDLRVGKRSSTSKVKLVAQLVSTQTGEVVKSFEAHAEVSDGSYGVEGGTMGIGGHHQARSGTPIEKASNDAIKDLSVQIAEYVRN